MRRRQFFTVIASALLSASAQAQQAGALRRVGVLFPGLLGEERERLITEGISGELGTEKVTSSSGPRKATANCFPNTPANLSIAG